MAAGARIYRLQIVDLLGTGTSHPSRYQGVRGAQVHPTNPQKVFEVSALQPQVQKQDVCTHICDIIFGGKHLAASCFNSLDAWKCSDS